MIYTKSLYPNYHIGEHTYGEIVIHGGLVEDVEIGDYCSIAPKLQFQCGGDHYMDFVSTYPFPILPGYEGTWENWREYKNRHNMKITVGNDVWVGLDCMIRHGCTVGNGAIIGMGSVIVSDIPDYAIAAGNPAKVIRYRFTPEQIKELLKIAWWNWSEETLLKRLPDMDNVDKFIAKYST